MTPAVGATTDERGFSLAELLVVMAVLGLVMAAVVTVYQQGTQSYLIGAGRVEAQQNGRVGLELLIRELRTLTAVSAIPSATDMTFVDQNGVTVRYQLVGTTLNRIEAGTATALAAGLQSFGLTYYSAFNGATNTGTTTAVASSVRVIRVQLVARAEIVAPAGSAGAQQSTVESAVRLRNL